jgi:hypothetical protein
VKKIICLAGLAMCASTSFAISDEDFKTCVKVKEITQMIVEKANKGVSREDLKARFSLPAMYPTIDFVYDWRGAKTDQEIIANQMNSCLERHK